jgi:hypothetical protein
LLLTKKWQPGSSIRNPRPQLPTPHGPQQPKESLNLFKKKERKKERKKKKIYIY